MLCDPMVDKAAGGWQTRVTAERVGPQLVNRVSFPTCRPRREHELGLGQPPPGSLAKRSRGSIMAMKPGSYNPKQTIMHRSAPAKVKPPGSENPINLDPECRHDIPRFALSPCPDRLVFLSS